MRALVPGAWTALALLAWAAPAFAHGLAHHEPHPGWTFDPWVVTPLVGFGLVYGAGALVLWRRAGPGRRIRIRQGCAYLVGWLSLAGALVSPLHWYGEHLFTAHMIEHEIVMAVAAPLLALARPGGTLLWALPGGLRRRVGAIVRGRSTRAGWGVLTRPAVATTLHGLAIWGWHIPVLFDAAVEHALLHRLQHVTFLLSALLFWWALLRRDRPGQAVGHLFITMLHTGVLGALMALAPRVLYGAQTAHAADWGLTPLEDQQLAGLVMWIPAGTVYAGAALAFAALWIRGSGGVASGGVASRVDASKVDASKVAYARSLA